MEISNQLIRPFIDRMETEWQDLYREISDHGSEEASALRPSIEQRMRQLEKFRVSALYSEQDEAGLSEFSDECPAGDQRPGRHPHQDALPTGGPQGSPDLLGQRHRHSPGDH